MPNRVWFISEQYHPQETATGYLLTALAEGLAHHLPVNVVCTRPGRTLVGMRVSAREKRNNVAIQRCMATTLNKDLLLYRLINLATASCSIFLRSMRQFRKGDCVVVVTNPPSLPFLTAIACWLVKARCVLLIHDVYPEVLVATGLLEQNAMVARFLWWLNKRLYRSARGIVVLGRDMQKLVSGRIDREDHRVVIIPNWAELEEVVPRDRRENDLLRELGLIDRFVVQYAGNMGRPNDVESLIESAKRLRHAQDIHFLFIGSGAKRGWLERAVVENGLPNVTILPSRSRADQSNFLNACDMAVISLIRGMSGVSVPSRTYNSLAAGKPIIAVAECDSELALLTQEEQVGWVVPPHDPDAIVAAILDAKQDPARLHAMGARARLVAEKKYSLSTAVESYLSLISSVCTS